MKLLSSLYLLCSILWQLEHSNSHFNISSFITVQDLLLALPIANSLSSLWWWNSNAAILPFQPHLPHLPPNNSTALSFVRYLLIHVLQEPHLLRFEIPYWFISEPHNSQYLLVEWVGFEPTLLVFQASTLTISVITPCYLFFNTRVAHHKIFSVTECSWGRIRTYGGDKSHRVNSPDLST